MARRKGRPRGLAPARKEGPDRKSLVKYVRGPRAVGSRRRTPACFIKGVESFIPRGGPRAEPVMICFARLPMTSVLFTLGRL